jgi:hypothetical protein
MSFGGGEGREADVGGHPRGILLLLNVFFHKIKIMIVQRTLTTL